MSLPLHALLVENSEDDALLLVEALRRDGYEPEFLRVQTAAAMRAALAAKKGDIILCDYVMPNFDAPAALRIVQEVNPALPVNIVSGTVGEAIAVATIKQGAVDYLMQDRLTRLGQAVAHALEQKRLRRERTEADEALKESMTKIHRLLGAAPVGIGRVVDRVLLEVNAALCQMLGYSREELNSLEARLLYSTDEDYQSVGRHYIQLIEQNRVSFESRFRAKDGRILDVAITAVWLNAANPAAGVVFAVMDINERKRTERALQESEEKFAKAFRASPYSLSISDLATGTYLDVNNGFEQVSGYTRVETIGRTSVKMGRWINEDERD